MDESSDNTLALSLSLQRSDNVVECHEVCCSLPNELELEVLSDSAVESDRYVCVSDCVCVGGWVRACVCACGGGGGGGGGCMCLTVRACVCACGGGCVCLTVCVCVCVHACVLWRAQYFLRHTCMCMLSAAALTYPGGPCI